jgi:N-acetyl sugar amidotransferase|tara:strand:+ start:1308 stop:2450 length:1143 start_codon:yes stop_codon:yes gene_type:complete
MSNPDKQVKFCKRCCEPDTRPDCIFDDEGVCLPCRYHETLDEIDWSQRERELDKIAKWGKERNVSGYDCIIGVSGGKDSHRQAIYARDELGMKPLLVSCAYPPEQITERGANNLGNLCEIGFDVIVVSPAPQVYKRLIQLGVKKYANWCKTTELALYGSVPRIAVAYNIPLIFLGENPALSWGSYGGSLDGDANKMKYCNTLKGAKIEPYLEEGFRREELFWYDYPSDEDMERAKLRLVYLGYYIRDFNDYRNAEIAIEHGMKIREGEDFLPEEIGQINEFDALDDDFVVINQMWKWMKFGFGKVSEQVSGAIRNGVMTKKEAIEMIEKYDGKCGEKYIIKFCNYVGISRDEFDSVTEGCRNNEVWVKREGKWVLRNPVR